MTLRETINFRARTAINCWRGCMGIHHPAFIDGDKNIIVWNGVTCKYESHLDNSFRQYGSQNKQTIFSYKRTRLF